MSDLYERLEELQDMTRILAADVTRLGQRLGERSIQAATTEEQDGVRRAYVRAVFALVEAVIQQHKRLLLDLLSRGLVAMQPSVVGALSEQAYVVDDNGTVTTRDQYLQLRRKLRAVYRSAGEALGTPLGVRYDDAGWRAFSEAVRIRDRITHPQTYEDCHISGDDLDTVDLGHKWFRGVNDEFVRIAGLHRKHHHW